MGCPWVSRCAVLVEQVRDYYRNYYSPNTTLVIVGDFETDPPLSGQRDFLAKYPRKRRGESRGEQRRRESREKGGVQTIFLSISLSFLSSLVLRAWSGGAVAGSLSART